MNRRSLLKSALAAGGAMLARGTTLEAKPALKKGARVDDAYRIRVEAARCDRDRFMPAHLGNGDEDRYPS